MPWVSLPLQLYVPVLNCAYLKFRWFCLLCQALHKTLFSISCYASCPLLYWGIPHAFGLKFHLQQTYCSRWLWSPSALIPLHLFSSFPFILCGVLTKPAEASFPGGLEVKASARSAGDLGLIPGLGRSPGEGNGNPLQYSCWRIPWTEEPGGLQSTGL